MHPDYLTVRDVGDLAGLDLLHHLLDLLGVLGALRGDLAEPDAARLDVEDRVGAALERAVLDGLDRVSNTATSTFLSALVMTCAPR